MKKGYEARNATIISKRTSSSHTHHSLYVSLLKLIVNWLERCESVWNCITSSIYDEFIVYTQ